jgi:hypothetical protein
VAWLQGGGGTKKKRPVVGIFFFGPKGPPSPSPPSIYGITFSRTNTFQGISHVGHYLMVCRSSTHLPYIRETANSTPKFFVTTRISPDIQPQGHQLCWFGDNHITSQPLLNSNTPMAPSRRREEVGCSVTLTSSTNLVRPLL